MKNSTPPSIQEKSFDCPHCHTTKAPQTWFCAYATKQPPVVLADRDALSSFLKDGRFLGLSRSQTQSLAEGKIFFWNSNKNLLPSNSTRIENLFLSQCYICQEIAVWVHDKLVWPPQADAETEDPNPDMPEDVRRDYEEARLVLTLSPRSAAALLRLCIEKLCAHAKGRNLNEKIGTLVQEDLKPEIQKALDSVRVIGNEALHPGTMDLKDNKDTARTLFKLVNRIVHDLITSKREIKEIYESLPLGARERITQRDRKSS